MQARGAEIIVPLVLISDLGSCGQEFRPMGQRELRMNHHKALFKDPEWVLFFMIMKGSLETKTMVLLF